jgi:hypothetical protein
LFYGADGEAATNGRKLPLFTSFTCGSGDFAEKAYEDETLERLLVAPNGGAIGLVASTGKTHRGEVEKSDGNWWMDKEFYSIFFNDTFQPGKALYEMKRSYMKNVMNPIGYEKYKAMLFGYNYMGDPELNIWTDQPGNLQLNVSGLWLGPHNITVSVYDEYNYPVPNTRVCIQNAEIYAYGVTNETGVAQIFVNPTQLDTIDIVATAHNFLPLEKSYALGIEPVDLMITANDIKFSSSNPAIDQVITVNASIKNRGQTDFTSGVNITFSVDGLVGSGGKQIGSNQYIQTLAKGASKKVSVTWAVVPGTSSIYVQIDPENIVNESYEWNNIASKSIYVRKPDLYIESSDIEFIPDSEVYSGTKIQIKAKIHNAGDAAAKNVKIIFIDKLDEYDKFQIGSNKTIENLGVGGIKTLTTSWTSVGGEREIVVIIDPDNSLEEFDEQNNQASKNITINYAVGIRQLPDLNLGEDNTSINATRLVNFIDDPDTSILNLDISVNSSNENCMVILNDYLALDVIPAEDWYGTAIGTVTVSDGGSSANSSFKIEVTPINDAPRFKVDNFTWVATEDSEFKYQLLVYDPEQDNITYSDDSDLFDIDPLTGEIKFNTDQDHVNNSPYHFNITISDGKLKTKSEFTLIVNNDPDPPVIMPIENQVAVENKLFQLQIIAIDIDSSELYYYIKPTHFSMDIETGLISFTPAESDIGAYDVKVTVTDETFESTYVTFKLTIGPDPDKNNNGNHVPNGSTNNGSTDKGGQGNELFLFIGLIVVIIIIVIIILLLIRKRKQKGSKKEFFTDDYLKDKQSQTDGPGETYSDSGQAKSAYDEEYRRLYSTPPQSKSIQKGSDTSTTGEGKRKKSPKTISEKSVSKKSDVQYQSKSKADSRSHKTGKLGKSDKYMSKKRKHPENLLKRSEDTDDFEVEWE